ncbi:beta-lactamase class A [Sediminibacterium ginsengisoli]|uniref:beta-lactamase n=2 Tax=Sediminibacterium ginsengisoli TaxID=413434 RepID=A0A1T4K2J1_9BACT|nr:beta-lactamase class A [Sediminibacterium ginsengisoli]
MRRRFHPFLFIITCLMLSAQSMAATNHRQDSTLTQKIQQLLSGQQGVFAVAFKDLATGETILINEKTMFHAASTMKTPVMIELYKQAAAGTFSLQDSALVRNEFKSIVDGSLYRLDSAVDSQRELYRREGERLSLNELIYQMIIRSGNLATNILIEILDGKKITATMRELGAPDIQVLRGVEDQKAFDQGLNNTTTAYDQMKIYEALANGKAVNKDASDAMIRILLDQQHNTVIPALLPKDVKVAHKTGSITSVHHDAGIVFLPDGRKYVLALLSAKFTSDKEATGAMARVSQLVYRYMTGK